VKTILWGKGLTLLVGLVSFVMFLSPALTFTAVAFGLLATTIQYAAGRISAKLPKDGDFATFVKGYAGGMGLRVLGVVILAVVCSLWPAQFPALGAAVGYLGVLIPLLFLETRATR
jgi:hypothetical protein